MQNTIKLIAPAMNIGVYAYDNDYTIEQLVALERLGFDILLDGDTRMFGQKKMGRIAISKPVHTRCTMADYIIASRDPDYRYSNSYLGER